MQKKVLYSKLALYNEAFEKYSYFSLFLFMLYSMYHYLQPGYNVYSYSTKKNHLNNIGQYNV